MTTSLRVSRKAGFVLALVFQACEAGTLTHTIVFNPDLSHVNKMFVKACFCQSGVQEGKRRLNTMERHWVAPHWEVPEVLPSRPCVATMNETLL